MPIAETPPVLTDFSLGRVYSNPEIERGGRLHSRFHPRSIFRTLRRRLFLSYPVGVLLSIRSEICSCYHRIRLYRFLRTGVWPEKIRPTLPDLHPESSNPIGMLSGIHGILALQEVRPWLRSEEHTS